MVSVPALTFSAGAQNGGLPSGGDSPYTNPQPCGPGDTIRVAFMPEPHEITEGHFALFDAYWEDTTATGSTEGNSGILHTNTCPPEWVTTTQSDGRGGETTVSGLSDSTLDIEEAIFHVTDDDRATVVATNAAATAGQLSLDAYSEVHDAFGLAGPPPERNTLPVPEGTHVWWLRLDDPRTTDVDEGSALTLGFSTRNLNDWGWYAGEGVSPLSYQLEVERHPSHPNDHPHFFAYALTGENRKPKLVWSSANAGVSMLKMDPGTELQDLEWIFTEEGTYEIWVELVGHVRTVHDPAADDSPDDWAPLSPNKTETSEVKRYVFQVGDFEEEEPPLFGLDLSVPENSPGGTVVSPPLPIL